MPASSRNIKGVYLECTKVLALAVDALLAKYPPPITSMF